MRTVAGLFENEGEARRTIDDLKRLGVKTSDISIVSKGERSSFDDLQLQPLDVKGAGPLKTCGPMRTYITRATAQNRPDAIVSALTDMGLSQADAERYIAGVRKGYMLETVVTDDDRAPQAFAIMQEHMNRDKASEETLEGETILPVIAETLVVGKREVGAGGLRATTQVHEVPVEETVSLRKEHVDVERRPVDRPVGDTEEPFRERTVEVIATSEEPVVTKDARVVEEVVVRKDVDTRTATIRDTVRRMDVDVEEFDPAQFKEHFERTYKTGQFEDYAPAYQFGRSIPSDPRFARKDWPSIESTAQSTWEEQNPNTWDRFKDAVKHAWERASGKSK